ncbi:hypothetical protein C3F09_01265 [candidate division GN15 bacterium]|uniref:Metallo-beta-lactamase domain-containing protein n=1 Tax=candidate division GN15 bacterium TaxID=2072418 RepID=A0A855XCT4_9BACT|nr:MAG: hypothetical protein C3F09_01265 [candidate division GN15 bacterium]
MRVTRCARTLCLWLTLATVSATADPKPLTVTYVGNTGYLIQCGGHKIAIDALLGGERSEYYDMPSDSVVALMTAARPPFDGLDVIAVTHWHQDHFSAGIVAEYLKGNSGCRLLCPQQVADRLSALDGYDGIRRQVRVIDIPVDSVTEVELDGVMAKVLSSKHGSYYETDSAGNTADRHRNVRHLEFLFTVGGRSLLHVGDAELQDRDQFMPLGLGKDSIDIAFIQRWGCKEMPSFGEKLIRERVRPKRIYFTHMAPKELAFLTQHADCPSYRYVTIPTRSLQTWIVP